MQHGNISIYKRSIQILLCGKQIQHKGFSKWQQ
jgi:hypothetical protein